MKIKITEQIAAEVKITETYQSPNGKQNYTIDYLVGGVCVHSATTGLISGSANPIAMLDREYTINDTYYQDIDNPIPTPDKKPRTFWSGTSNGRPAWGLERAKTHRQAIIEAVAQIII